MSEFKPRLIYTVRQFAERYPFLTEASLRRYIFEEETNGFSYCLLRAGRKVLIEEPKFFDWLEGKSNPASSVEDHSPSAPHPHSKSRKPSAGPASKKGAR